MHTTGLETQMLATSEIGLTRVTFVVRSNQLSQFTAVDFFSNRQRDETAYHDSMPAAAHLHF